MAFKIREGLHKDDKERRDHILAIGAFLKDKRKEIFIFLYENLNILDSKTSALLGFNFLMITIMTIVIAIITISWIKLILVISFSICGISTCICLKSISLHWASTKDLKNVDSYLEALLKIRDGRTESYRLARILSIFSAFIFLVTIIIFVASELL